MKRFSILLMLSAFMLAGSSVSYGQDEQPTSIGIEKIAYHPPGISLDVVAVCNIQTHDVQSLPLQTTAFVMAPSFSQEAELISAPVIERNLSKQVESHYTGACSFPPRETIREVIAPPDIS